MLNKIIVFIFIFFVFSNANAERLFIIDTDVGVDDAIAILYFLKQPGIEIKAITIASDGNAHCKPALANTLGLLKLSNKKNIPVACGRLTPLSGKHHFPEKILQESDTLAGTANLLPPVSSYTIKKTALNLLADTLKNTSQKIDILAIGPLTNIAEFIQQYPALKNKIRMIYIMGGAIQVPGNLPEVDLTIKNHVAEWNIYLDPLAASIVFQSGIPITLIPLDITNQLPIDWDFYQALKEQHHIKFVYMLFQKNEDFLRSHQWYFWDPLAAVVAADESIAVFQTMQLRVLLTPELLSGATIIDNKKGSPIRVCTHVDKKRFKKMLLNYI